MTHIKNMSKHIMFWYNHVKKEREKRPKYYVLIFKLKKYWYIIIQRFKTHIKQLPEHMTICMFRIYFNF